LVAAKRVGCSDVAFAVAKRVGCSDVAFAVAKRVGCSEVAFVAGIVAPAAKQFRCQIGQPAMNQFSLPISTIGPHGRNDLNASNNFMV